jgi:hypothetical protein
MFTNTIPTRRDLDRTEIEAKTPSETAESGATTSTPNWYVSSFSDMR